MCGCVHVSENLEKFSKCQNGDETCHPQTVRFSQRVSDSFHTVKTKLTKDLKGRSSTTKNNGNLGDPSLESGGQKEASRKKLNRSPLSDFEISKKTRVRVHHNSTKILKV